MNMEKISVGKERSPAWQYVFCMVTFLSAFIFLKPKVSFTNSGEITFYLVEILGLLVGAFLIFYLFKNFKTLSKNSKILFWTAFISQAAFLIIYAVRIFTVGLEMKSILIIESNLFVLGFYLLIVFRILSAKCVLTSLSYFSAVLGVASVVLIYVLPDSYTDWVLYWNENLYVLTFGNAVRTFIMLLCLPLTAMNHWLCRSKASAVCFYVHLASLVVCGMISGARVNYLCIPLAIFLLSAIFIRFKRTHWWRTPAAILGLSALMIVAMFVVSCFSMRTYTQLMRLDITKQVMVALDIQYIGPNVGETPGKDPSDDGMNTEQNADSDAVLQEMLNQAEGSAAESASSRTHMWKLAIEDIKAAPLFGNGLKQYEYTFGNGVTLPMQAHNFILEYILGFGLVGFVLWLVMMAAPEWLVLRRIKFRFWNHAPFCFAVCSMLFACCGALFQPYFLYPCIMFFVFTLMGCYYEISVRSEEN